MNSLNKDQWTAVDERFDKLSLKHYYPKKGSDVFEGFRANLHSELEKVRQETIKNCMAMLPDKEPEDHTSNRFPAEECRAFNMAIKQAKKNIQSLSINKKEQ